MAHSKTLWNPIVLFLVGFCFAKDGLYRLIDRDIICDDLSVMQRLSAYSLSTCATACKLKKSCGMFSLKHVFDNSSLNNDIQPKKNVMLECVLCRTSNLTSVIEKKGWSMYMVNSFSSFFSKCM